MSSMRVLFSHIKKKLNSREIKSPLKATKLIKNIQFQLAPRPVAPSSGILQQKPTYLTPFLGT